MPRRPDDVLGIAARVAAFLAGLAALLGAMTAVVDYGARHNVSGDAGKIVQVMRHSLDPAIAVFGASNAEVGVSSPILQQITGKTVFNFALDGNDIQQFGAVLREFLSYTQRNEDVLLVVNPFSLTRRDAPHQPNAYYPHVGNQRVYEAMYALAPQEVWRLRHVPFYGFVLFDHRYYKSAAMGLTAAHHPPPADPLAGFVPTRRFWDEMQAAPPPAASESAIDPDVLGLYRAVVRECESRGRRVIVVFPPLDRDAGRWLRNLEELSLRFASLVRDPELYLDYHGRDLGDGHRYYYNFTHLNAEGAAVFSEILGRDLKRLARDGDATPERGGR